MKKQQSISTRRKPKIQKLKTSKRKKASSIQWIKRQINDPYVAEARSKGYRARSAFKIIEINDKFKIFKKGFKVLDLGSAPGGWSQVAVNKVGRNNVFAVDILDMNPIPGVQFVKQDFLAPEAEEVILEKIGGKKYDVVMSDMAANTTGNKKTDHIRTSVLLEEAFNFAIKVLKSNGSFVGKIFQGGTEPELFAKIKKYFREVKHFKPKSSRKHSVEMFVVAKGFRYC